jgi:hypothetical protein
MNRPITKILAGLALVISVVVAGSLWHKAKVQELTAWQQAQQARDAHILRVFIAEHPRSEFISEATGRLKLLEARDAFAASDNAELCISFLKEHSKTEFATEAMSRLEALSIAHAIIETTNALALINGRNLREIISILTGTQKQTGQDTLGSEEIGAGLRVLSAARKYQQGFGVIRLQGIEPVGTKPIVVENALGSSSFKMTGTITTGDGGYKLTFAGVIGTGASGQAIVVAGRGQMLLPGKGFESDAVNVLAHQTVAMQGDTFLVSAELPGEYVLLEGGLGMSSSFTPKCPMGEGSIFRFRGEVRDFFSGVTFSGDDHSPLCFALLRNSGLTYLCGRGTLKTKDGEVIKLPVEAKEIGNNHALSSSKGTP